MTDPPLGIEYEAKALRQREAGRLGIWRLPPAFDGSDRRPVPRFTTLTPRETERVRAFFAEFADAVYDVMAPGAHLFIATTPVLSHLTY